MGHEQDIVKQLQRCLKDWKPNKRRTVHTGEKCCQYIGQLYKLHLCNLGLELFPTEVGQFSFLKLLYLSNNQLKSLPSEIGNLSALEHLDLSYNHLSTLPAEFGYLSALWSLDLSSNQLITLPAELGNAFHLESLDPSHKPLPGCKSQHFAEGICIILPVMTNPGVYLQAIADAIKITVEFKPHLPDITPRTQKSVPRTGLYHSQGLS